MTLLKPTLTPPTLRGLHDLLMGCARQEVDPTRRRKWAELALAVSDLSTTDFLASEPLPGSVWQWACQTCGKRVAFAGALTCSEECDQLRDLHAIGPDGHKPETP